MNGMFFASNGLRTNAASVSLLQRHFRIGYQAGLELANALEEAGIISSLGPDGYRALANRATSMRKENEANNRTRSDTRSH